MHVYVTIHVFGYYAISAAVLIFGLDNEEQHIFTLNFWYFGNQSSHHCAGKTFDRITTSVLIIIPLTTLLCVLVQQ